MGRKDMRVNKSICLIITTLNIRIQPKRRQQSEKIHKRLNINKLKSTDTKPSFMDVLGEPISNLWGCEDNEMEQLNIIHLPEEILEKVLSYLTYHELSETRLVCQAFDKLSQSLLNQGFTRVDKFHAQIQKQVKSRLPRRESERRNHPLARHVDILSAIETRLSLLSMTYMRYIDTGLCCFIPGKVLDELYRLLQMLRSSNQPPRAHEFLQELRDISSMAMEHFEEKISHILKQQMPPVSIQFPFTDACGSQDPQPGTASVLPLTTSSMLRGPSFRHELVRMQNQLKVQNTIIQLHRREALDCRNKLCEQRRRFIEQEKRLQEQERKLKEHDQSLQEQQKIFSEQTADMERQDRKISDLSKKILEYDQKFADISSEISRIKGDTELSPASTGLSPHPKSENLSQTFRSKKKGIKRKAQELSDDATVTCRKKI
ncbi:hypothetical protein ScPMuIL_013735 [Solemya velum]